MEQTTRRSSLAGAALLILLGAWFLAVQLTPTLSSWVYGALGWPLLIVGAGVLLLLVGLLTGTADVAAPASVIAGIGALLTWQNATGRWDSWSYAWTFLPGFAGVGTMLAGLLQKREEALWSGGWQVLAGVILSAAVGPLMGGPRWLGPYWPVLLIAAGTLALAKVLLRRDGRAQ
jgi:hypothetical protein